LLDRWVDVSFLWGFAGEGMGVEEKEKEDG
jgi:hypothetical protein